ncbi:MAG: hypothetical protein R3240_04905, partial [Gammaproteobacteria bacterium]|nr:hypothetical protein [Gammaproteobacteria bacterium]
MKFSRICLCLVGSLVISGTVQADDDNPPLSSAYLLLGQDNYKNRDLTLGIDLEFKNHMHLTADTYRSYGADKFSGNSTQNHFSISSNPYKLISIGASVEET